MGFTSKMIPFAQKVGLDISSKAERIDYEKLEDYLQILESKFKIDYLILSVYLNYQDMYIYDQLLYSYRWQSSVCSVLNSFESKIRDILNYSIHIGTRATFLNFDPNLENFNKIIRVIAEHLSKGESLSIILNLDFDIIEHIENIIQSIHPDNINKLSFGTRINADFNNVIKEDSHLQAKLILLIQRLITYDINVVYCPCTAFILNEEGYPVLPKFLQYCVKAFVGQQPLIVLEDDIFYDNSLINDTQKLEEYILYLEYLYNVHEEYCEETMFIYPYRDVLQIPLQPLRDNLNSKIYESFEMDTTKYEMYSQAIDLAISDIKCLYGKNLTLAVLGGGRGPLVEKAFENGIKNGVNVKVLCYEKNLFAYNTLKIKFQKEIAEKKIILVLGDMRAMKIESEIHIIVSELLGSFGDNELSPECLEAAETFLIKDGVMIPSSYTSFLTPVSYHHVHQSVRSIQFINYETSMVVLPSRYFSPYTSIKKVFHFDHPSRKDDEKSYIQAVTLKFNSDELICKDSSTIIHGFMGYFESVLYKNVILSTNPATKTPKMNSWFPIYFPIKSSLTVKPNQILTLDITRNNNKRKVWYDWQFQVSNGNKIVASTIVHNLNGDKHSIEL